MNVVCKFLCYIVIYIIIQHHNDTTSKTRLMNKRRMIMTQEGRHKKTSFRKNILPLTLLQGFERVVQGFASERVLETEHKHHILTPLLWPSRCVFLVLFMLGSTPSGLSEDPFGRVWLSLPHLVSNSLEVCWQLLWHPTQLNYIIIQRPHDHPLDLWNRMFNRHQAEIPVMQFRGYSLPVHHC